MPKLSKAVKIVIFVSFCVLFATVGLRGKQVKAYASGPPTQSTGAPGEQTCAQSGCHTGSAVNSGTGTLTLTGLPASYSPNQEINLTVTMSQSARSRFGFQVTAIDDQGRKAGDLIVTDSSRTFKANGVVGANLREYINHSFNGTSPSSTNQGSWGFRWKAPAQSVGRVTFYVAGNSANNNGQNTGDLIYTINASIQPSTAQTDLSLTATTSPNPVFVGTNLTYTLTVSNLGPATANGVTLTSNLPNSVTLVSVTPSVGTCSPSGSVVSCALGAIPNAGIATVTIVVKTNLIGQLSLTANVIGIEPDLVSTNNSLTQTTLVSPADLSLTATTPPNPVFVGTNLTYTLTVSNLGPATANGVTLTSNLPNSVTLVSVTPSVGTCSPSGSVVSCALGAIPNAALSTVVLVIRANVAGEITIASNVTASEPDPVTANNSISQSTIVNPQADLRLTASASASAVLIGSELTYTLTVTNLGPSTANSVALTSNLPSTVTLVSALAGGGNCTLTGSTLGCTLGVMGSGSVRTITIIVKTNAVAAITLTASVSANEPDLVPTNNNVVQNTTVNAFPVPVITNVTPDWITNRKGAFTLIVTGANFVSGSVVRWNSVDRPTVVQSSAQLTASIAATDIPASGNVTVNVVNPAPGGGASNPVSVIVTNFLANASAASYGGGTLATESIVAAFGADFATSVQIASTLPLPLSIAGTSVTVRDNTGVERAAPLFFVSPTQVNYLIPAGTSIGTARVTVTGSTGAIAREEIQIAATSPGLFSSNSSGQGIAAGQVLRFRADNTQSYEIIARYDSAQNVFVPVPIDLGAATDQVFLILYGTGLRNFGSLGGVSVQIGGTSTQVLYAGPQGDFVGLDQINLRLPRTLIGRGDVDIVVSINGRLANKLLVSIK